jgi:hypothetical protein
MFSTILHAVTERLHPPVSRNLNPLLECPIKPPIFQNASMNTILGSGTELYGVKSYHES